MNIPLLNDILIIFALSITVLLVFSLLRLPTILGFLLTGILAGPHALGLVRAVHEVEVLAEIGVVMLLFTIGIEFSLRNLLKIKRAAFLGGFLQVSLTILFSALICTGFGISLGKAIFTGFLVSLSSTAIVLRLLQERAEVYSPQGRASLGILIFQDIIIVPMMLITPILAGASEELDSKIITLLAKGVLIVLMVIVSAKWVVPWVLYQITRTRSSEMFLLVTVVICLGVAWLTSSLGLSLALGAFLAGLIISESEYSQQALSNVLPFRDIFTSFFFVSIGMLLNVGFFIDKPITILVISVCVLALKMIVLALATILIGFPLRTALLVGLSLSQIGEFSFILSRTGFDHGLLDGDIYQIFLSVTILTMAATPLIIMGSPRVSEFISGLQIPEVLRSGFSPIKELDVIEQQETLRDHLIIIGFGVNGRNLAHAARVAGIRYVTVEMNPDTVREEKARGEPIIYGDATQEAVLALLGIQNARVMVIAISDPAATRRIISIARKKDPKLYIIARTRFVQEMEPLYRLGSNEVIPEEFETSVEIFTRVLMKYLIPKDKIEKFIADIRSDRYEIFREPTELRYRASDLGLHFPDVEICTLEVSTDSPLIEKTLSEAGLRRIYGVTVLAIRRDSQILTNPSGDERIVANDNLIVLGKPDSLLKLSSLF